MVFWYTTGDETFGWRVGDTSIYPYGISSNQCTTMMILRRYRSILTYIVLTVVLTGITLSIYRSADSKEITHLRLSELSEKGLENADSEVDFNTLKEDLELVEDGGGVDQAESKTQSATETERGGKAAQEGGAVEYPVEDPAGKKPKDDGEVIKEDTVYAKQYNKEEEIDKFIDQTFNNDDSDKAELKKDLSKMTDEEIREKLNEIKEKQIEQEMESNKKKDYFDDLTDNVEGTLLNNEGRIRSDAPPDSIPWAKFELDRIIPKNYEEKSSIRRENATLFTLCRNSELYEMLDSIHQLEARFNNEYHYDWVFLNEEPFSEEFIELTSNMVSGRARYGLIPKAHWSYPAFIDQQKAKEIRESRKWSLITYGSSESYRHMCRFNSLFFYKHPIMDEYQYYWRVEPHVKFHCDIEDPFKFLRENKKKYGFTISMRELPNTIESLWETTRLYFKSLAKNYFDVSNNNLLKFISDDDGESYNLCHYWTNFEVANLDIYRNELYEGYVQHLDKAGGFFYERWGDAPIHSIIFSLILEKEDIFMFQNISYEHTVAKSCPLDDVFRKKARCICDPNDNWVITSESSCNMKFLEVGSCEKPKDLDAYLESISERKKEEEILRSEQRQLRMETARRQSAVRRKKAEERRKNRLEAQKAREERLKNKQN